MANDLTKIPVEVIVDLINATNGTSFTSSMLTFDPPVVNADGKNTSVTVRAANGSGYKGFVVSLYNRLHLTNDIATPFQAAWPSRPLEFLLGDATTIADLVPELNQLLGINLTPDDFVDGPLPEFTGAANESHPVQVVAKADSLCYTGSVTFTLKAEEIELSTVITQLTLNGLTYAPPSA